MRSPQEDIELLDQYIKGTLSTPEIQVLELRLSQEQDLKNDLEALKALRQGMRAKALEEKMRMMREWEEEMEKPEISMAKIGSETKIFTLKKFMAAASMVVLLGVGWWWMKSINEAADQNKYAWNDEEFYKYILHKNERSTSIDVNKQRSKAYNLFTIQEFEEAKPQLESLWQNNQDTLAYFYLGITHLSIGNKHEAKNIFMSPALKNYPITDLIKKCE